MQCDKMQGFTLVEAMIAIFILTVMMLTTTVALVDIQDRGVENVIRQEAVKLGQELINDARNEEFSALPAGSSNQQITRQVAGFDVSYGVQRDIAEVVLNTAKSVNYVITWTSTAKSNAKSYTARTLVGRR